MAFGRFLGDYQSVSGAFFLFSPLISRGGKNRFHGEHTANEYFDPHT